MRFRSMKSCGLRFKNSFDHTMKHRGSVFSSLLLNRCHVTKFAPGDSPLAPPARLRVAILAGGPLNYLDGHPIGKD
jgi:hypothetical protein